jgi:hypothetical protein
LLLQAASGDWWGRGNAEEKKKKINCQIAWGLAGMKQRWRKKEKNRQKRPHNACMREIGGHISWM